jgi:hypothetical protein
VINPTSHPDILAGPGHSPSNLRLQWSRRWILPYTSPPRDGGGEEALPNITSLPRDGYAICYQLFVQMPPTECKAFTAAGASDDLSSILWPSLHPEVSGEGGDGGDREESHGRHPGSGHHHTAQKPSDRVER